MSEIVEREWLPVMDPTGHGFFGGFDPHAEYEFRRGLDGDVTRLRMSDQSEWFNIASLWWRPLPDAPAA